MRSELSGPGCLNAILGLSLLLLVCFGVGMAFQVGWIVTGRIMAPEPTPTPIILPIEVPIPTALPTTTLPPLPVLTPTPAPASPTATRSLSSPTPSLPSPTASPAVRQYTVQEGDTLFSIARQFNLTIEELTAANPTLDPDLLAIGDVLIIPESGQ